MYDNDDHQMSSEIYAARVAEWLETMDSFLYLIKDMESWYHFCLFGFFFVPSTGKYVEVSVYQNDNPEFTYRCITYTRLNTAEVQILQSDIDLIDLIEKLLYRHDPDDFFPMYVPVKWELVEKDELIDSQDMKRIDEMYRLSKKPE